MGVETLLNFVLGVIKYFGLIALVITGIMVFEEHDYVFAGEAFAIFLVSLLCNYLLTKLIEKKVYGIDQKEYTVVLVSDRLVESYEDLTEEEFEAYVHPFDKESELFDKVGNVGIFYEYTPKQWKEMFHEVPIDNDPTFIVTTANKKAKMLKAMTNPFLVTSKPVEVVRFLKEHQKQQSKDVRWSA